MECSKLLYYKFGPFLARFNLSSYERVKKKSAWGTLSRRVLQEGRGELDEGELAAAARAAHDVRLLVEEHLRAEKAEAPRVVNFQWYFQRF